MSTTEVIMKKEKITIISNDKISITLLKIKRTRVPVFTT